MGTAKINVKPTQVREQMPLPVFKEIFLNNAVHVNNFICYNVPSVRQELSRRVAGAVASGDGAPVRRIQPLNPSVAVLLMVESTEFLPERLCLGAVLGSALGLVGPGAAREAAVRGVVACDVARPVAAGGRALELLTAARKMVHGSGEWYTVRMDYDFQRLIWSNLRRLNA